MPRILLIQYNIRKMWNLKMHYDCLGRSVYIEGIIKCQQRIWLKNKQVTSPYWNKRQWF